MPEIPAGQSCIYEQEEVQQAFGETLRPGGLALTQRAIDFCKLPAAARVLDVGCGTGRTVEYLQTCGYRAGGIDLSAALLRQGHRRSPHLPLAQGDAARLPLAAGQADALLVECSLSVFPEAGPVLAECQRLLRPNGYLVVSDIYARNPAGLAALQSLPPTCCFSRFMIQADLLALLDEHGFNQRCWEDHSATLKAVAARLIATPLLQAPTGGKMDALDLQLALAKARPGYFLLIAQKR